ncbi:MAG: TetR/AcrR family transcriptional regulator [Pseudonocardia sp.]
MAQAAGPELDGPPPRRPRRDAARNHELLLRAAMSAFRDEGFDVPLDAIARRAGVGNATLYRHFATREELYDAVFADLRGRAGEVLSRYQEVGDARAALAGFVAELFTIGPAGFELGCLADRTCDATPALEAMVEEIRATLEHLLAKAQRQGTVRRDVDVQDLGLLLAAARSVMAAAGEGAPGVWRRHLALLLDALRPGECAPLPPAGVGEPERERIGRALHDMG